MGKYMINFVEYNEMMALDADPYQMLLNPITVEQLKEGLDNSYNSYIRYDIQAKFLSNFIDKDINASDDKLSIDKEEVYIAIRFIGPKLPENLKYLSEDHDIEIYMVKLIDGNI